jgi:predicted Zn finger-like uncharacterized protein
MIITCPHCQTKYQVAFEAIGSAGRKVQCAHCQQAWQQEPMVPEEATPPKPAGPVDPITEDAMDEAMAAEESAAAEARTAKAKSRLPDPDPTAHLDAAEIKKRQVAFARRQNVMTARLPLARLRRGARAAGIVMLISLFAGAYIWRVPIVERYPDLAGVYEAVGLGVNVVGLEFAELHTLKTLSEGNEVLTVSAQIVGLGAKPAKVPPVVVSLIDAHGHPVYEWSVSTRVPDLMAGERATFDTRLSLPPSEAVSVRLSFASQSKPGTSSAVGAPKSDVPPPHEVEPIAPEPIEPDATAHGSSPSH